MKYFFNKDDLCFLIYVIFAQKVKMEDKRIEKVQDWPEPKSIKDV